MNDLEYNEWLKKHPKTAAVIEEFKGTISELDLAQYSSALWMAAFVMLWRKRDATKPEIIDATKMFLAERAEVVNECGFRADKMQDAMADFVSMLNAIKE